LGHCVDAAKLMACDIHNLALTSQVVINDLHTLYLTKAYVEGTSTAIAALRAAEITPINFGLTDDFLIKTNKFNEDIINADKSET
jgi:hypothetical protein